MELATKERKTCCRSSGPACDSLGYAWLPVTSCVITALTFATTYSLAVVEKHIGPSVPYISDTGATPPESCIFTLGLSFLAISVSGITYVRYKALRAFHEVDKVACTLSRWALCFGLMANVGLLLVGSFQETNVGTVHLTGASLAFGAGAVYCVLQTVITHRQLSSYSKPPAFWVRAISSAIAGVAAVTSITARFVAKSLSNSPHGHQMWGPMEPGYAEHLTSTIGEWIAGAALQVFILSFVSEFRELDNHFHKKSAPTQSHAEGLDGDDAANHPFLSGAENRH